MSSKLFAALISLTIVTAAACRSNSDGGGATPAPTQQASTQTTANAPVSNSSNTATPAPVATSANSNANADACKLLTSEEIQAVQGEGVKATKGTDASTGAFAVSQCFYETASFTNSVSLTLTKRGVNAQRDGPRDFWKRNFSGEKSNEREKDEREKKEREEKAGGRIEEEEEGLPPTPVKGVGEEAFWVGNAKVGALYVLKGDKYIRISLGGGDTQEKKIEKSKTLAQSALKRI